MAVKYNNALPYIQVEAENIHLIIQQHITVVAFINASTNNYSDIKHEPSLCISAQILFPLFKQHHKEIEEQAAIAHKTFMEKLGICSKNKPDKSDKGEKITKSLFKKMESSDKKESDKKET